ncbi:protein-disulfide reductase DsbD family protein [Acetobacter cerevisiae]|uniref:protein-disulfide reductase DsbD family protein n=1 Tax=Acetobacter cerevisiae TaxID=178900 RepID=UPI0020A00A16|nr:protein-disulfide reductase DsbD domain-containing protein [Acetobacter cerevisiae]MCP1271844.1 thioredoxin family protein [Acetobacter cerevisiae]MCP1279798.1 thioredoxin family protein [Acetobacter cerevisiae]
MFAVGATLSGADLASGWQQANAAESAPVSTTGHSVATLITDTDTTDGKAPLHVALRLKLQDGWHTYWRNPGDAGEAPDVTVTADGAFTGKASAIVWPTPHRIPDASLMSYAYTGDVVLPMELPLHPTGAQASGPTTLKAHASWLVCENVCVPEEADLAVTLQPGPAHPSAEAPLFAATAEATPVSSPYAATVSADGVLAIKGADLSARSVQDAWFMPDQPGLIDQAAVQKFTAQDGNVALHLKRLPEFAATQPLSGLLVLKDAAGSERALSLTAKPVPALAGAPSASAQNATSSPLTNTLTQAGFLQQVVFAFLGGLILNLMPCVFPILAMKALSLARLGKAERRTQVTSAACYSLGVMVTFLALGGVMMGLRVAGAAADWGFQFQSPLFVTLVTWLLFAMALNLLGVFEFMPVSAGSSLTSHAHGHWHDVVTGILAVVVATPCTAPFMGVAIAGALSGPPAMGLIVFAAMGLGLAAPYLLLTTVPGLAARLPKPGAWMQYLRQFLAFPLLGSCVWLLWVASLEGGASVVLLLATGLVLLGFAAWIYGVAQVRLIQQGHTRTSTALHGLALLGLLGALALVPALRHQSAAPTTGGSLTSGLPKGTEPFSEARLKELHAAGKPVFVDMTAAWCITCLVNERVALDIPSTQAAFAAHGVTVLRGDWTNHDSAISAFLKAHGRDGVPFYLYVPANGPEAVLPQILTPGLVASTVAQ